MIFIDMAKEEVGITVKKDKDFSEWYTQVVQKAELADIRFGIQGFIVHRPFALRIIRKIYDYLEEELEKDGHEPFLFPTAVKEENLMKEKEHAGFTPDVFWITEAGTEKIEERFALRPTGEAQIYPLYSLWIRSYNDLPFKGYQSRISVFRNEKTTRPFLRGREFLFLESHDVFKAHEEAIEQVKKDLEISEKVIYGRFKIPFIFFKRPQWDKFLGADDSYTPDTIMPDGRKSQLASTHDLGQNFSKAYKIKFRDKDEKDKLVWQTCYGPGIWRILAAAIGIHGDNTGLVLPFEIAPIQIVIVPILYSKNKKENKSIIAKCKEVEKKLNNYRVKFDNSEESPGFKYNKWEMFGVPLRIEIGERELKENRITLVKRTDKKKMSIGIRNLLGEIERNSKLLDNFIKRKADSYLKDRIKDANNFGELKKLIDEQVGFVRIPFCSVSLDGKKCAEFIKEKLHADVCGTVFPESEKIGNKNKCMICNKKANHIVYVAKSY